MNEINDKRRDEIISAMLFMNAPDIAYSVFKKPHEPKDYGEVKKKERVKINNLRREYQELLHIFKDEPSRNVFLASHSDISDFIKECDVTDDINKKAARECVSSEEMTKIGKEAVEAVVTCAEAIKNGFGDLEQKDFISKLSGGLFRPDLGYAIFKTNLGP